jgi:hypothetical protein
LRPVVPSLHRAVSAYPRRRAVGVAACADLAAIARAEPGIAISADELAARLAASDDSEVHELIAAGKDFGELRPRRARSSRRRGYRRRPLRRLRARLQLG